MKALVPEKPGVGANPTRSACLMFDAGDGCGRTPTTPMWCSSFNWRGEAAQAAGPRPLGRRPERPGAGAALARRLDDYQGPIRQHARQDSATRQLTCLG
jgi:hypothetical protein